MKLEKFSKNKKQKRIIIATIVGFIVLIGGITLYRTFALYEEKKEFNVLRGKVPDFGDYDIKLAFTINGNQISDGNFPNKGDGYAANSVTCKNGVTAEWNYSLWGLVNIKNNDNVKIECNINFISEIQLSKNVAIGDYINYYPKKTSYSISTSYTGYTTSTQTINPSELTLWRVININDDGTIELLSEYTSSNSVYFYGQEGYKRIVCGLNHIASQYENDTYTVGSRYMGYNGQTEILSSLCKSSSCLESQGGGDATTTENNMYANKDIKLVEDALGNLIANKVGSSTSADYWLASRHYQLLSSNQNTYGYGRHIDASGNPNAFEIMYMSQSREEPRNHYLRPIVVLKAGLTGLGTGSKENPWTING